jgi:phospholipid/cholesterol/gamma-HCH transport system permease protein
MLKSEHTGGSARLEIEGSGSGVVTLRVAGELTNATVPELWTQAEAALSGDAKRTVVVEAAGVNRIDGAGMAWLLKVGCRATCAGGQVDIRGLAPEYHKLLERFDLTEYRAVQPQVRQAVPVPEQVGRVTAHLWDDFQTHIGFVGELTESLLRALLNPRSIRWRDLFLAAERTGADAVPIVALICCLVGLVLAFQSGMAMRPYGAEIYVANLVTIAMLRELGPLMTAIILSGRSGAAYAAELGTMKVNDEVAALTTMGLNPVPFLTVPRVLGMVVTIPFLTMMGNITGILGGALMFLTLDYPMAAYFKQVLSAAEPRHLLSGLVKSVFFGLTISGVGCMRGLQTARGSSAVGLSATRAVVTAILLIVILDAIFGTLFYFIGF